LSARTPEGRLEAALAQTLEQLPSATGRPRAALLKRAGDVCVSMGEPRKALGWYGKAVDQYLELADPEQAALLCRLIIFVQPEAVRARCTLTWIALGAEQHADAAGLLADYVEAARTAGQTAIAAQQLGWMFEATRSEATRARIVIGMLKLGESDRAEALAAELEGVEPPAGAQDREELWARVLQAAVGPTPAGT
jgi:tetratricopeptide (TPR) repeat protein